ncbi:uncharacterized protein LOC122009718 isoform X2 [Zingiber officinale]|uniref:uncharacterized protein LOC122009718 isoform X2 n=1 Tax=Zingiber officinale TaxID=94328 RepID=UPI001C4ACBD0|nr:uncharacterized protein LOC122009718 isoform X2 [Zingiber officinale]
MKLSENMRPALASSGLDGSNFVASYNNGQRVTYSGSALDRSRNIHDSLENRILATGSSTLRNTPPGEIPFLFHYPSIESFSMSERKYSRSSEFQRILSVAVEENTFGSVQSKSLPPNALEDLKRSKTNISKTSTKARNLTKLLQNSIFRLDRYRNLISKKRQTTDRSNEKSGNLNSLKMGGQSHADSAENASPRLEDRTKNLIPKKRMRSSMAEVRGTVLPRQAAGVEKDKTVMFDKDRGVLKGCNVGLVISDDKMCRLPPGGDGWEKNKRKRSVGLSRISDGDRELKQSIQQRPKNEPRLRSSNGIVFRPGLSCGTILSNTTDSNPELSGANSSCGTPKNELDSSSVPNERQDHSVGLDNEQSVSRGSNRLNIQEDTQVGNQIPLVKGKTTRIPRTSSNLVTNAPSNFLHSFGSNDCPEQIPMSKIQTSNLVSNRRRVINNDSVSPPVTQWVGQRPHKISRTRRVNVVSPVSNSDGTQFLHEVFSASDVGTRMMTTDTSGHLVSRGITSSSHQSKLKHDNVLPPLLSESEESTAIKTKFKGKTSNKFALEDGVQAPLKATTLVLPIKNKPSKEEIGIEIRRQGRSRRGSVHSKSCLPLPKEKLENIDSTKPLKNGKHSSERSERIGRPPKNMSDRKVFAQTQNTDVSSLERTGESEDDQEELLAAANAARNASYHACSSDFWKNMESCFASATLDDLAFLKNQIHFTKELDSSFPSSNEACNDMMSEVLNDLAASPHFSYAREQINSVAPTDKSFEDLYSADQRQLVKTSMGRLEIKRLYEKPAPLSHRLLSAFIIVDEIANFENDTQEEFNLQFSNDNAHYGPNSHVHAKDLSKMDCPSELDCTNQRNGIAYDGFLTTNNFRHSNLQNFMPCDDPVVENHAFWNSCNGSLADYQKNDCNLLQTMKGNSPYECQYGNMSLDDRILMELNSIGIYLDTMPDFADCEESEIDKAISELKFGLHQQARKKINQLDKLELAVQDAKKIDERKLEQLAMNKLVEMAHLKLMDGRGSHKSSITKVSKQLALSFAKRAIARCHDFEAGRSCFSELTLQNVLMSAPLCQINTKHSVAVIHKELRNSHLGYGMSEVTSVSERHDCPNNIGPTPSDPHQSIPQWDEKSSTRTNQKEVLLDDVTIGAGSRTTSNPTHTATSVKWKRAESVKDPNKDAMGRGSMAKVSRPSLGRGERRTKAKPKQKISQQISSANDFGRVAEAAEFRSPVSQQLSPTNDFGRVAEAAEFRSPVSQQLSPTNDFGRVAEAAEFRSPVSQESFDTANNFTPRNDHKVELQSLSDRGCDPSKAMDDGVFTNLQLPGMDSIDELDVGLGRQGPQDIASWLNVEDEELQDNDLMGLQIPMDDLSEINMNFLSETHRPPSIVRN